jgi:hypothetical protein
MTATYVTCHYLDRRLDRCTAEALDPDAEMVLCARHLAAAGRMAAEALTALNNVGFAFSNPFTPPAETGTTPTEGEPA